MTRRDRGRPASRARAAARPEERARARPAPERAPALPLDHPGVILVALLAAATLVVGVTFPLFDTDFWQHLLVGKVIWQRHAVPTTQLWSWPTYGAPDVNGSWGFRALIWPVWKLAGVTGLFAWRWVTTLLVFGLLWATARRMGARGLTPLVVVVVAGLIYRQRVNIRPETLVGVLIALELLVLETRRVRRAAGAPPGRIAWAVVPILWIWINVHISYHFGLLLLGAYAVEDLLPPKGRSRTPALLAIGAAALVVGLANPFGWRALWQPFDFFLFHRHEDIFLTIGELEPIPWRFNLLNGLPVVIFAWPLLAAARALRERVDRVELVLCAIFTALAFGGQRFVGPYVLVATPFLARDLDAWVARRAWPRWSATAPARVALASLACIALAVPELGWSHLRIGMGVDLRTVPVEACDFMAAHGVRGRAFNPFHFGGYLLWRFWPERDRLPFMDIHQAGTPGDRALYAGAFADSEYWNKLDRERRFDFLVLWRRQVDGDRLLDMIDADSSWALVFKDDAGVLYVRRHGPLAAVADSFAYHVLPAGRDGIDALGERCAADTSVRRRARLELEREAASSRFDGASLSLLANIAMLDERWDDARTLLQRALAANDDVPTIHERLGDLALQEGRIDEALAEYRREIALHPDHPGTEKHMADAFRARGDLGRARAWYRRALHADPTDQDARDSLAVLEGGTTR